ncbi:MAG: hypothetical protein HYX75_18935 [Acidobacteria bacterium]|nr:hypothetical protein [Acidobacteriota bacterium]
MQKKIVLAVLVFGAGVAVAIVGSDLFKGDQAVIHTRAMWKDVYRTPTGLVAGADVIALARHESAVPGRIVGRGRDATPFTNNRFAIESVIKGNLTGRSIVVEQTGGRLPDGAIMDIDDGGPYEIGTRYLLFLKEGEDGMYFLINHQARYALRGEALEGVDPTDEVIASFHGANADLAVEDIRTRVEIMR